MIELKGGEKKPSLSEPPSPKTSDEPPRGRALGCASCRRPITSSSAAIEVAGAHEFRFVNPDDMTFHIGCFQDAHGLKKYGPSTLEYTWFPGYSWQVELCTGCNQQLGWFYRSTSHSFHGLILDSLVEIDED